MIGCRSPYKPACTSASDLLNPSFAATHVWHDPMIEYEIGHLQPAAWYGSHQVLAESGTQDMPLVVLNPNGGHESVGWLSNVDIPNSPPQRGEDNDPRVDTPKTFVSSSKKPRGRPKKRVKVTASPKSCKQPPSSAQNSCLEALNTWNLAKQIGISSTEESLVLSGLRKSRRLMIMDGSTG